MQSLTSIMSLNSLDQFPPPSISSSRMCCTQTSTPDIHRCEYNHSILWLEQQDSWDQKKENSYLKMMVNLGVFPSHTKQCP